MNFNKAIIGGRMVANPELRQSTNGTYICSFSVAVNRYKDEEADFFECVAFKERAELISRNFKKGSNILVCGKLKQDRFTDKEGNKRSKITVTVDEVTFVDRKDDAPADFPANAAPEAPRVSAPSMGSYNNGVYNPYAPGGSQARFAEIPAQDDAALPF